MTKAHTWWLGFRKNLKAPKNWSPISANSSWLAALHGNFKFSASTLFHVKHHGMGGLKFEVWNSHTQPKCL